MIGDGTDVELQLAIWGYVVTGDVAERDALIAETRDVWFDSPWDRRASDLENTTISVGGRLRRPPLWFCLRWLSTELMERGIIEMHEGSGRPC